MAWLRRSLLGCVGMVKLRATKTRPCREGVPSAQSALRGAPSVAPIRCRNDRRFLARETNYHASAIYYRVKRTGPQPSGMRSEPDKNSSEEVVGGPRPASEARTARNNPRPGINRAGAAIRLSAEHSALDSKCSEPAPPNTHIPNNLRSQTIAAPRVVLKRRVASCSTHIVPDSATPRHF